MHFPIYSNIITGNSLIIIPIYLMAVNHVLHLSLSQRAKKAEDKNQQGTRGIHTGGRRR